VVGALVAFVRRLAIVDRFHLAVLLEALRDGEDALFEQMAATFPASVGGIRELRDRWASLPAGDERDGTLAGLDLVVAALRTLG
jgi:Ni,Fe-hydrogenase III component G